MSAENFGGLGELLGLLGGGKYVQPEQVIDSMRASQPVERSQTILNMLLTTPLGNRMTEQVLGRIRFVSRDAANPNELEPYNWMLSADQKRRLGPNTDDLLDLTSFIIQLPGIKGYGDWSSIRQRIGGAKAPSSMAMMEVWGPRNLEVQFPTNTEQLTFSMADMIGKLAYTDAGLEAFNARATDKYGGVLMNQLGFAVAEALNKPNLMNQNPVIRQASQAEVIAADIATQNGEPVHGWAHLQEVLSGMPFMAESLLNLTADQMEYAQHAYGGFAAEQSRATWGSLYFIDEGQLNHQLGPELHLLSAFGGLISQYAEKGGLNWMFDDRSWASELGGVPITALDGGGSAVDRGKSIKEITTYQPRQGDADLIEARMMQMFVKNNSTYHGRPVTPENIHAELARIPTLGRTHLRPPALWVPVARRLLRSKPAYMAAWNTPDANVSTWGAKLNMPLNQTQGLYGFAEFLQKASEKGTGIYEWNNFEARMVGDQFRYADKVAVTSEAMRKAGQEAVQSSATVTEENYAKGQKKTLLTAIQSASFEAVRHAAENLKDGEKDTLKWMSGDRQEVYIAHWFKGVVRGNLVPFFDDSETLLFDFDESEFIKSGCVVVKPKKFWRDEVEAELSAQGRSIDELDTLMAETGSRWSVLKGRQFMVNSNGRPAYKVATSLELYVKAAAVLNQLESQMGNLDDETRERVHRLREVHTSVRTNGWNRFSINWWQGYTPSSVEGLVLLINLMKKQELIGEGDVDSLVKYVTSKGQPGDDRLIALGKPKSLNRPLGSNRGPELGLPDPRYMKPDDLKFSYQPFSAQIH
jgi:hypothetical protein